MYIHTDLYMYTCRNVYIQIYIYRLWITPVAGPLFEAKHQLIFPEANFLESNPDESQIQITFELFVPVEWTHDCTFSSNRILIHFNHRLLLLLLNYSFLWCGCPTAIFWSTSVSLKYLNSSFRALFERETWKAKPLLPVSRQFPSLLQVGISCGWIPMG